MAETPPKVYKPVNHENMAAAILRVRRSINAAFLADFGPGVDGNPMIDAIIIDRNKYGSIKYEAVPYPSGDPLQILATLSRNLERAAAELRVYLSDHIPHALHLVDGSILWPTASKDELLVKYPADKFKIEPVKIDGVRPVIGGTLIGMRVSALPPKTTESLGVSETVPTDTEPQKVTEENP